MSGTEEIVAGLYSLGNALMAEERIEDASVALMAAGWIEGAASPPHGRSITTDDLRDVLDDLESGQYYDAEASLERLMRDDRNGAT